MAKEDKAEQVVKPGLHLGHGSILIAVFLVAMFGLAFLIGNNKELVLNNLGEDNDTSETVDVQRRQAIVDESEYVYFTDYVVLAMEYWQAGELDGAYKMYIEANELNPESVETLTAMAALQRQMENADLAIEHWNEALDLIEGDSTYTDVASRIVELIKLTQAGDYITSPGDDGHAEVPL